MVGRGMARGKDGRPDTRAPFHYYPLPFTHFDLYKPNHKKRVMILQEGAFNSKRISFLHLYTYSSCVVRLSFSVLVFAKYNLSASWSPADDFDPDGMPGTVEPEVPQTLDSSTVEPHT